MNSLINRGVSVIVCCYNSAWVIRRTLNALSKQVLEANLPWEVLLVDNNSTDDTAHVFQEFLTHNFCKNFRLVNERQQGLSHARVKGYSEAKYEILVYCDDDNLLNDDYLQTAFDFMMENPRVGQCGGLGEAIFETEPDPRIMPFLNVYATGPQGPSPVSDISDRGFVNGAGMVTRKSILKEIFDSGFEFFSTDRLGSRLSTGGDVEIGYAIKASGYKILYNESLKFKHVLSKKRLSWEYLCELAYGAGNSNIFFHPDSINTYKSNPLYIALHYYFRLIRRIPKNILGIASPNEKLKFRFFTGSVVAVNREFWKLFWFRSKAKEFYIHISKNT